MRARCFTGHPTQKVYNITHKRCISLITSKICFALISFMTQRTKTVTYKKKTTDVALTERNGYRIRAHQVTAFDYLSNSVILQKTHEMSTNILQ